MNIVKHRAFLDSLEGEKGLPGSYHGVSLSIPIAEFERVNMVHPLNRVERYLLNRIEYLESRQIPDLKEQVKEFGRSIIEAVIDAKENPERFHAMIALCEPEKDSKEVRP